jgi:ATP-dependent DNA helicase RecQ
VDYSAGMSEIDAALLALLKEFFGYDTFRPLQREIIGDVLAKRDVVAILPTGGGKSLCFQLPALAQNGLTVVISPLIALMKDQVDALQASGVAATFLNSTLAADEARGRLAGLHRGEYRLLYVAPERLMLAGMLEDLKNWNVNLIAVDEAHCISEWGHDFRPEYRQLASLRAHLPDVPVLALTATATEQVRGDMQRLLKLKDPSCYLASFNRPNLTYRVEPKDDSYGRILRFIQPRAKECGIVYCQSRSGAETLAEKLRSDGVLAAPYHAGLSADERARNQEKFLRDETRVICATIAFGMGINKPNVRFVIHRDLPKNIEGYYQETGRAGRDGLQGDCLLLFSRGDVAKQMRFLEEIGDAKVKDAAKKQLWRMVDYAESGECRRKELLGYFGETWEQVPCGACDNCTGTRTTEDWTVEAQKFLSCVVRIKQRSPQFGISVNYVCDVLTGAENGIIARWNHTLLSTHGIGKDHPRRRWQDIGRELLRAKLLREIQDGEYMRIDIAPEGLLALKERTPIALSVSRERERVRKTRKTARVASEMDGELDADLFETLRRLRKKLADERGVPPYIVFSDASLRAMAQERPTTEEAFGEISGVGEKKRAEFSKAFTEAISDYVSNEHNKSVQ